MFCQVSFLRFLLFKFTHTSFGYVSEVFCLLVFSRGRTLGNTDWWHCRSSKDNSKEAVRCVVKCGLYFIIAYKGKGKSWLIFFPLLFLSTSLKMSICLILMQWANKSQSFVSCFYPFFKQIFESLLSIFRLTDFGNNSCHEAWGH